VPGFLPLSWTQRGRPVSRRIETDLVGVMRFVKGGVKALVEVTQRGLGGGTNLSIPREKFRSLSILALYFHAFTIPHCSFFSCVFVSCLLVVVLCLLYSSPLAWIGCLPFALTRIE